MADGLRPAANIAFANKTVNIEGDRETCPLEGAGAATDPYRKDPFSLSLETSLLYTSAPCLASAPDSHSYNHSLLKKTSPPFCSNSQKQNKHLMQKTKKQTPFFSSTNLFPKQLCDHTISLKKNPTEITKPHSSFIHRYVRSPFAAW